MLLLLCFSIFSASFADVFIMETNKTTLFKSLRKAGIYSKYRDELLKQRSLVTSNSQTGVDTLSDYYDDFYIGKIQLGTPAQTFNLVMDTGSSDLWVISSDCNSIPCNGYANSGYIKNKFYSRSSSTFSLTGRSFKITYGSGYCNGSVAKDRLSFGSFIVQQQDFGLANFISSTFGYQPMDGIFGMAWPNIATTTSMPPLQNIMSQMDQPIFTVYLGKENSVNQGRITYGGFDNTFCDPTINYVNLIDETWWIFRLDGFSVSKYSYNSPQSAISDTGTSWIGAPPAVVSNVAKQVGATWSSLQELYLIKCSKISSSPTLYFTINGIKYDIDPPNYILDLDIDNGVNCVLTFFSQEATGFNPKWTLGDTFIRGFCNVYDFGQKRIGFARVKGRPASSTSTIFSIVNIVVASFAYIVFH